jgi:hypothetical protein
MRADEGVSTERAANHLTTEAYDVVIVRWCHDIGAVGH